MLFEFVFLGSPLYENGQMVPEDENKNLKIEFANIAFNMGRKFDSEGIEILFLGAL